MTCKNRRKGWRAVALLLVGFVASNASAPNASAQEERGVPTTSAAVEIAAPLYTPEDLRFLSHMIVHHEQALELAALVPSRTTREEFIRFARYVDGAQRVEIDQMTSLLRLAAERGLELPDDHFHDDPPMAGMLSKAQMAELAAASAAEFERLWLEGMIHHHQGALDMARAQQQRQFESGRRPYGIDVLVDDILVVQRAEITKMRAWLEQWGLARRRPVSAVRLVAR